MARFRIDRALSIGFLGTLRRPRRESQIPILMYHGIRNELGKRHPYFETNTSAFVFERHMQLLRQENYRGIHLTEAVQTLQTGDAMKKVVAITFDDGYCNFYTRALPLLEEYGFTATVFVASGLVGRQDTRLGPEPLLTWQEIREANELGIEVGSHTVAHLELYRWGVSVLQNELTTSKAMIEDEVGKEVCSFAFPYAFPEHDRAFTDRCASLLKSTGYTVGVCTAIGTAGPGNDQYFLPRLPINSYDDDRLFAAKLEGRYDWLHRPQYLAKWVNARFGAAIIKRSEIGFIEQ